MKRESFMLRLWIFITFLVLVSPAAAQPQSNITREYYPDGTLISSETMKDKSRDATANFWSSLMRVYRIHLPYADDLELPLWVVWGVLPVSFLTLIFLFLSRKAGGPNRWTGHDPALSNEPQETELDTKKLPLAVKQKEFNPLREESAKMYRQIIETVDSGIFIADISGKVSYANHSFITMLGYKTRDQVAGLDLCRDLLFQKPGQPNFIEAIQSRNQVKHYVFPYRRPDGTTVILSIAGNFLFDDRGEKISIEGVVLDVTEKHQLEEAVLTEKRKMEHLLEYSERVDIIRERAELLQYVVDSSCQILEANRCSIMLEDIKTNELIIASSRGLDPEIVRTTRIKIGEHFAGIVAFEEKPALIKNIEYDSKFSKAKGPNYLGRSFMIVPFRLNNDIRGVINVSDKPAEIKELKPFNDLDLKVLTAITGKFVAAMENIQLFRELNLMTVTDPMTQIFNYRLFSESLGQEISRMKREKGHLCIMMMDIDHFKTYNDSFGHQSGDELLRGFSRILKESLRDTDIICRYAGDEFCVVLPDTQLEGARMAAEKVREVMSHQEFKRPITLSIGVAEFKEGMGKKELIEAADQALYQAKKQGRDRVMTNQDV